MLVLHVLLLPVLMREVLFMMMRLIFVNQRMKKIIVTIRKDLESGNALSKCFANHPKVFDTVVVNLIKAGEASGKQDTFLQKNEIS